jgi:hypothetical protein
MKANLLTGLKKHTVSIPRAVWQNQVKKGAKKGRLRLDFMMDDHHKVREFVVLEIPRLAKPIPPAYIAQQLGISFDRVSILLDELEKGMTFLYRNNAGDVTWAYPVTADPTPHRVIFSSGEEIFAA